MTKNILIPIADGTEEIEAIAALDLFRRAEYNVVLASENEYSVCSRGVVVKGDKLISEIDETFDLIYLPGGLKGTENLKKNKDLIKILKEHYNNDKNISAICAAPTILLEHGLLHENSSVTSHPSMIKHFSEYNYSEQEIVVDDKIFTSRGAGTTIDFALFIIEKFSGKSVADNIANNIIYNHR